MIRKMIAMCALAVCCAIGVQAQTGETSGKASAVTIDPAKSFDALLNIFEGEMMGVVKEMQRPGRHCPVRRRELAPGCMPAARQRETAGKE